MAAQWVADGDFGVVEIFGGVVTHAEFFHDPAGALVSWNGEGDDLRERESCEGVIEKSLRAFCGEAPTPVLGGETPADFDAGSEVGLKVGIGETDEAEEFAS